MAISVRHYIFEESGAIKRVPRRMMDGLVFGQDAIPEYAGTRQRVAEVLVEKLRGHTARILEGRAARKQQSIQQLQWLSKYLKY